MSKKAKKVVLEPALEEIAREWDVLERLQNARMFESWSRQLYVSAFMMAKSADDDPPTSYARLRRLRRQLSNAKTPKS